MSDVERYYNEFYRELAALDAAGNDYSKIADLIAGDAQGSRLRVLDVGCGYGTVSETLVSHGHDVYGVEIGDAALRSLKGRGIRPIKADIARRFPVADASVDLVLVLDVLEHVFNPLWLLTEAHRVLRRGGAVVVTVPLYFDVVDRIRVLFSGSIVSYDNLVYGAEIAGRFRSYNYDHIRFFRPSDLDEMMKITGFAVERRVFLPVLCPRPLAFLRPFLRLLARGIPGLFAHAMKLKARKS